LFSQQLQSALAQGPKSIRAGESSPDSHIEEAKQGSLGQQFLFDGKRGICPIVRP